MNILFLSSGGHSCRSLMAKTILESLDDELVVYAATTNPPQELSPEAIEVMQETGLILHPENIQNTSEIQNEKFDYLITLSDGTRDEYKYLPIHYGQKLHLGFADPEKTYVRFPTKLEAYRSLRDEIKTELHYFYYRILKRKTIH